MYNLYNITLVFRLFYWVRFRNSHDIPQLYYSIYHPATYSTRRTYIKDEERIHPWLLLYILLGNCLSAEGYVLRRIYEQKIANGFAIWLRDILICSITWIYLHFDWHIPYIAVRNYVKLFEFVGIRFNNANWKLSLVFCNCLR